MNGGKFASQNWLDKLLDERKFTVFALFYFVFEGKFQVQALGGLYPKGRFNVTFFFLRYEFGEGGGGGLFSESYGIFALKSIPNTDTCKTALILMKLIWNWVNFSPFSKASLTQFRANTSGYRPGHKRKCFVSWSREKSRRPGTHDQRQRWAG